MLGKSVSICAVTCAESDKMAVSDDYPEITSRVNVFDLRRHNYNVECVELPSLPNTVQPHMT